MTYIENAYVCLAAPLLFAIVCMKRDSRRSLIFLLAGMTVCLFSSYVTSFVAGLSGVDAATAAREIAPATEEILKFVPLLFYLLVFEPEKRSTLIGALLIAVGFATFENVLFLTSYGTADLLMLLIRGFGTGAMHVVCGVTVATGLSFLWDRAWLRAVGTLALLGLVTTVHAVFNVLVAQTGAVFWVGATIPVTLVLVWIVFLRAKIDLS